VQRLVQAAVIVVLDEAADGPLELVDGGPYLNLVLDQVLGGNPLAVFSGTGGAWGLIPYPPTSTVRLEAASNELATTSFSLLEVGAGR
jgi:hypothetical protein